MAQVPGVFHQDAGRDAVDDGIQERPGAADLVLGMLALGDVDGGDQLRRTALMLQTSREDGGVDDASVCFYVLPSAP